MSHQRTSDSSQMTLSRRQFLVATGGVTLAAALAACAAPAPGGDGAAPSAETSEINFLIRTDIRNAYAGDAAVERWNEAFGDRPVILDEPTEGGVDTKIQAAQAAGDLIWDGFTVIAVPWDTARWINQGLIQPLDDFISVSSVPGADQVVPGIIPSVLESSKAEGKQYAIPGNVGSVALGWYNDILDEAGVERIDVQRACDDVDGAVQIEGGGAQRAECAPPFRRIQFLDAPVVYDARIRVDRIAVRVEARARIDTLIAVQL